MNITSLSSLYALIVNTFYLNALNANRRTILSSFSYYNAPSTCVRFPLKTEKFLSVFTLFLPPVHTYPMKTLTKIKRKRFKTLSKVENDYVWTWAYTTDFKKRKVVESCLHRKILVTEVLHGQTMKLPTTAA